MTNPQSKRRVEAYAIVAEKNLLAWGTVIDRLPDKDNVWQFPIFFSKKDACAWRIKKGLNHPTHKVVPCIITYNLPKKHE